MSDNVVNPHARAFDRLNEDAALRTILEGTATETGQAFFAALVKNLAKALTTHGAWVTEYLEDSRRLRALAFWLDAQGIHGWEMGIDGTPCQQVIESAQLVHFPIPAAWLRWNRSSRRRDNASRRWLPYFVELSIHGPIGVVKSQYKEERTWHKLQRKQVMR